MSDYNDVTRSVFSRAIQELKGDLKAPQVERLEELLDRGLFHVPAEILQALFEADESVRDKQNGDS